MSGPGESQRVRPVVLVHGAWHGGWCWAALQAALDRRGVPSYALDLPGHGASVAPLTDMIGDAASVGAAVSAIADRHGPVVLAGHSYGGVVVGQAAGAAVPAGAVAELVFVAAFCLDVGEGLLPFMQSLPPVATPLAAAMRLDHAAGVSTVEPGGAVAAFYGRCEPAAAAAAVARLGPQPLATFTQPVTAAGWRTVPSTYVRCTDDRAIPIEHQDVMAPRCGSVVTIDTDHSPFLSAVEELAGTLASLAGA